MIFESKYLNQPHITYLLYLVFYNTGVEFIHHLAGDVMNNNAKEDTDLKKVTCDILDFGFFTNKIEVIDIKNKIIFDKSNYKDLLTLVYNNFEKFLDINNTKYSYNYGIYYTNEWKKELIKIGRLDKSVLNK